MKISGIGKKFRYLEYGTVFKKDVKSDQHFIVVNSEALSYTDGGIYRFIGFNLENGEIEKFEEFQLVYPTQSCLVVNTW